MRTTIWPDKRIVGPGGASVNRPDAAPQKEACNCYDFEPPPAGPGTFDPCPIHGATRCEPPDEDPAEVGYPYDIQQLHDTPPSDAVPVAWWVEVEKDGDEIIGPVRLFTGPGESWEIQGVDEDCHEDEEWAKLLCEKHNATLYAHPEDAPEGPKGTTLRYDAKNRLSYVWLIWVLHEQTNRWELQGICTSEAELTPRVRAIKNDPNTIHVRTEVAFVDHLFAGGETVGDYANRVSANRLKDGAR